MPSIVWGRHPQEAHDNPYEYGAQTQFTREASAILEKLSGLLNKHTMQFHRDEKSLEKASWMLSIDLLDSLSESLRLLEEKRHRVAFRLFRDAVETMDLLKVLHSGNNQANKSLLSWYNNITPGHSESRNYIKGKHGEKAATHRNTYYQEISKFTHRTYLALLKSFSLGHGNMLVHDSYSQSGLLVLPHTIAYGYSILADLVLQTIECLSTSSLLADEEVNQVLLTTLETETVPTRFEILGSRN